MVKDNFPLKQEGCEQPQAQGDGAGKCQILGKIHLRQTVALKLKFLPFYKELLHRFYR